MTGTSDAPVVLVVDERPGAPLAARVHDALAGRPVVVEVVERAGDVVVRAERERPAAVVLHLDEARGFAAVRTLRRTAFTAGIPLVLTTAALDPEVFARHRQLPTRADAYLVEPYEVADLRGALLGAAPALGELPADERGDTVETPMPVVEVVAETERLLPPAGASKAPDFAPLHEALDNVEQIARAQERAAASAVAVDEALDVVRAMVRLRTEADRIVQAPPQDAAGAAEALQRLADAFALATWALTRAIGPSEE